MPANEIFDLRVHKNLCEFQSEIQLLLEETNARIKIDGIEDEEERIIALRSMFIDYYARIKNVKLVIGIFGQRPQEKYNVASDFANDLRIVFRVETIYCVKEQQILTNIH